jgi:TetR/AcrR family acrAB operon transcriptional repressor
MARSDPPRASRTRTRILQAARSLADAKPVDRIGLGDVARAAGVSWPTVKRHVGSREELRRLLVAERPELAQTFPDTRQRLLDAAARVLGRSGYSRATLDDVASEAGMTKGAVYWHFASKEEVFEALLERQVSREQQYVPEVVQDAAAAASTEAAFELLFSRCLQRARRDEYSTRLLYEFVSRRREEERGQGLRQLLHIPARMAAELTVELKASRRLPPDAAPQAVGELSAALLHGVLLAWIIQPGSVDLDAFASRAARAVVSSLE